MGCRTLEVHPAPLLPLQNSLGNHFLNFLILGPMCQVHSRPPSVYARRIFNAAFTDLACQSYGFDRAK